MPTRLIGAEFSEITGILEAVVAGKARESAIAREVGDSVLYHYTTWVGKRREFLGALVGNGGISAKRTLS